MRFFFVLFHLVGRVVKSARQAAAAVECRIIGHQGYSVRLKGVAIRFCGCGYVAAHQDGQQSAIAGVVRR